MTRLPLPETKKRRPCPHCRSRRFLSLHQVACTGCGQLLVDRFSIIEDADLTYEPEIKQCRKCGDVTTYCELPAVLDETA